MPTRGAGKKKGHGTIIGMPTSELNPVTTRMRRADPTEGAGADAPEQNPTVMKQAGELLEEVLAQAGGSLDDIGEMDDFDAELPTEKIREDPLGQNPTVVRQTTELLNEVLAEAGGSMDDIADLDEESSDASSAPGIDNLFPREMVDEVEQHEPLFAPSSVDAVLAPTDTPRDPARESGTPDPAVEDVDGTKSKSKQRIVTPGWLVGAALAVGVGGAVAFFAAKMGEQPVTQSAPAAPSMSASAVPTDPVEPKPVEAAQEPDEPAAASATPSANASPSASVAAPVRPAFPLPVVPRRSVSTPPQPVVQPGGNREDIYE